MIHLHFWTIIYTLIYLILKNRVDPESNCLNQSTCKDMVKTTGILQVNRIKKNGQECTT